MSTVEDFKNAPIGATATRADGSRIMKMDYVDKRWLIQDGFYVGAKEMAKQGCTLDLPAPTTARKALDLAWELAHEVKPGQVIPKGTRFLHDSGSGLVECTVEFDLEIIPAYVPVVRTLEPFPDWLDAPAVLARHLPSREEIADELSGRPIGTGYYQTTVSIDEARDMADAVLALLKGQEA